jgi:hypothetical protein
MDAPGNMESLGGPVLQVSRYDEKRSKTLAKINRDSKLYLTGKEAAKVMPKGRNFH